MTIPDKKLWLFSLLFLMVTLQARVIDGNKRLQSFATHQIFGKGDSSVSGLVQLNNGITVAAQACLSLDTALTLSGSMDVRSSGTVDLLDDLYLAPHFTFSTSDFNWGAIKGRGHTIFLSGPLHIQHDKKIKFIGDTIIDAQGNDIIFEPHAQLFVDHGVTLTLKNARCLVQRNEVSRPAIRLSSPLSQLALQYTTLSLPEDFYFMSGKLFIHGDVVVTGTARFINQSVNSVVVDHRSSLAFTDGMTYMHFPRTTKNDQIYLKDKTSQLIFDNATLLTTHTGMRLMRGTLSLDNAVTFSTKANTQFVGIQSTPAATWSDNSLYTVQSIKISHDGRYVAVYGNKTSSGSGNYEVKIFRITDSSLTEVANIVTSIYYDNQGRSIEWSPDDNYILVAGIQSSSNTIEVYKFTGTALTLVNTVNTSSYAGTKVVSALWLNSGKHILVIGNASNGNNKVALYSFSEYAMVKLWEQNISSDWSSEILGANISHRGDFLAVAGNSSSVVTRIYGISLSSITLISSDWANAEFNNMPHWSYDDRVIVSFGHSFFGDGKARVNSYTFDGTTLTWVTSYSDWNIGVYNCGTPFCGLNGLQIAGAGQTNYIRLFTVNNDTADFTGGDLVILDTVFGNNGTVTFDWGINNKDHIVMGGRNTADSAAQVALYKFLYNFDTSTQGLPNALIFGKAPTSSNDLSFNFSDDVVMTYFGKFYYNNKIGDYA